MRPSKDKWFLKLAHVVSLRSTCQRRNVGCVLVDACGHVLSTGYNGTPKGFPHCNEGHQCEGADLPSGVGLDSCFAVHAEQNALMQCYDVNKIETCYTTVSPCVTCVKLLLNTNCQRIVFSERYAHDEAAMRLWKTVNHGLESPAQSWEHIQNE